MNAFLAGKGFTYCILALYLMRCASYLVVGDRGRAAYWASCIAIVISAEFLIK